MATTSAMPAMSERDWQTMVLDLARLQGWMAYHPFDSRKSVAGFPDLTMVRGLELLFVELKTDRGRTRPEQDEWLSALDHVAQAVAGATRLDDTSLAVEVHVWRPAQFDQVQARLSRSCRVAA